MPNNNEIGQKMLNKTKYGRSFVILFILSFFSDTCKQTATTREYSNEIKIHNPSFIFLHIDKEKIGKNLILP